MDGQEIMLSYEMSRGGGGGGEAKVALHLVRETRI